MFCEMLKNRQNHPKYADPGLLTTIGQPYPEVVKAMWVMLLTGLPPTFFLPSACYRGDEKLLVPSYPNFLLKD